MIVLGACLALVEMRQSTGQRSVLRDGVCRRRSRVALHTGICLNNIMTYNASDDGRFHNVFNSFGGVEKILTDGFPLMDGVPA